MNEYMEVEFSGQCFAGGQRHAGGPRYPIGEFGWTILCQPQAGALGWEGRATFSPSLKVHVFKQLVLPSISKYRIDINDLI